MSKVLKTFKFIFWVRRISDVDHTTPVVYSLVKYGNISGSEILVTDLMTDISACSLENDKRIKFLEDLGVKISLSSTDKLSKKYLKQQKNYSATSKNFLLRIIKYLNKLILNLLIRYKYIKKIKRISYLAKDKSVFITDQGSNEQYKKLYLYAKRNNILTVSIPHGLYMHYGFKQKINDEIGWVPNCDYNVVCNSLFLHNDALLKKNHYQILGSARFCNEWTSILKKIYGPCNELLQKDKLNVLLLAEKSGPKNNPWLYHDKMKKVVDYLSSNKKVNLVIKTHPSLIDSDVYLSETATFINDDSQYTSLQLINNFDLTVATITSAVTDVFSLNKKVIFCVSPFNTVFEKYIPEFVSHSSEEFIKKIENKIKMTEDIQTSDINFSKLYDLLINPNKSNVLADYSLFFNNLIKGKK